jgi:hypothetical protein
MCASAAPVRRRPRRGPVCRSSRVLTALLCLALAVGLLPVQTARSAVAQEPPRFTVAPADDTIWGQHWQPGAEVTVVVAGVATSAMTDAAGTFTLTTAADIRAGDPVSVTEGATSRSHTVLDLAVDSVGVQADVVAGTTNVGTLSMMVLTDSGVSRHLNPTDLVPLDDGTFAWRADFSLDPEAEDLKFGSSGSVEQYDEDGDSTYSSWSAPNPHFSVDPVGDSLWGGQWAPEATVTVTVEGEHEPATTDSDGVGNFRIDIPFDIHAGDRITVADGETTSPTHTVTAVVVTDLDPDNDTVSGTAEAASLVHVAISPHRVPSRVVTADAEGNWTADFGHEADDGAEEERAVHDIAPGTGGFAAQYEVDPATYSSHWFAVTVVGWQVPPPAFPFFQVDHELDQLWGHEWPADAQLAITVTDGDNQVLDTTTGSDGEGNFSFNDSGFDFQPGREITVSYDLGGEREIVKRHVITEIRDVRADAATNTVCGAAAAGSVAHVWIWADVNGERPWRSTDVNDQGAWCVDFDEPGRDGENIPYQLQPGDSGTAEQGDDDGDVTHLSWRIANPRFSVELLPYHLDEARGVAVHGEDWAPGPVAVAVQEAPEAVPTSTTTIEAAEDGTFDETLLATDVAVMPGHTVTVSQNGSVKTLLVSDLRVTDEDVSLDRISGTTSVNDLGVSLEIWANIGELDPYADPSAFVVLGDGTFGWTIDLHPFDLDHHQGMAEQVDLDGDATRVWWAVERPVLVVDPVRDTLWGHEWPRRAELTISVGDVGDPDYTITAVTDQWGSFPQWDGPPFEPTFDLQPGQTVTVAFDLDGPDEVRKSHTITALRVSAVDPVTDRVIGTAEPNSEVYVHLSADAAGAGQWRARHVFADKKGNWTADFFVAFEEGWGPNAAYDIQAGTEGFAEFWDPDGDATHLDWRVPFAFHDALITSQGAPGSVDVLANDPLPAPDSLLEVVNCDEAEHGTVSCSIEGLCTYTPDDGFIGQDRFDYIVAARPSGRTQSAAVAVTVTAPAAPVLQRADAEAAGIATFGRIGDRLILTFDTLLDPATSPIAPEVSFTSAKALTCKDTALRCEVDGTTLTITVTGSTGARNLTDQSVTRVAGLADAYGQAVSVPQPVAITSAVAEPATLLSAVASTESPASFGRIGDSLTLTFSGPLDGTLPLGAPVVSFTRAKGFNCADRALRCQVADEVLTITVTGKVSARNLATESVTRVDRLTDVDGWLVTVPEPVRITSASA